jgi:hypothetical protein
MEKFKINYILFDNFQSNKTYFFEKEPTKEECKYWLWNTINQYEKETLDWELTINDIEIIKIKKQLIK